MPEPSAPASSGIFLQYLSWPRTPFPFDRLKPHNWSPSYTWLAQQDREASFRICPIVSIGGRDPSRQFNIECRVADASSNPYLALAAIVRAGREGLKAGLSNPPLFSGDPGTLADGEREELDLKASVLNAFLSIPRKKMTSWLVDPTDKLEREARAKQ